MRDVKDELAEWLARGERVAIATVVRVEGSAPRPAGATLIAASGDRVAGSVSNGCVEAAVYEEAMATLASGRARVVRYGISDELAFTVGLSCGGAIDVLVEPLGELHVAALEALRADRPALLARVIAPEDRVGTVGVLLAGPAERWTAELAPLARESGQALDEGVPRIATSRLDDGREALVFLEAMPAPSPLVIVGATHVGVVLARLAKDVGFRVVVADPRPALASRERFPTADEILLAWPDEALARLRLERDGSIVVLSHDPKFDRPALSTALRGEAGYIGAIGSRRTNEERFARLREEGFAETDLARVHAPIGLDLGARTAEETALAILAEVLAVRRGRAGGKLSARSAILV